MGLGHGAVTDRHIPGGASGRVASESRCFRVGSGAWEGGAWRPEQQADARGESG